MNIDIKNIKIVAPDIKYMKSYIEADKENVDAGIFEFTPLADDYKKSTLDFKKYINKLEMHKLGINLKSGYVPYSSFWLVDEENAIFIGQCSLRHYLNDNLRKLGGHIGYAIRPKYWGMGYGSLQLSLVLPRAKDLGIKTVLLTCYAENKASAKVMEKNGAVKVGEVINVVMGVKRLTFLYEIKLI